MRLSKLISFFKKNFSSLKIKLTFLYIVIFGLTLSLYCAFLFRYYVDDHKKEFDSALLNYTLDIGQSINVDLYGVVTLSPDLLRQGEKLFPFALGDSLIQLRTLDGKVIARSRSLKQEIIPFRKTDFDTLARKEVVFLPLRWFGQNYRLANYILDRAGPYDFVLQVAVPLKILDQDRQSMWAFFILSIPIILILAGLGGFFFASRAINPVNTIIQKANTIEATDLSVRIPYSRSRDELYELTLTLNRLLARIESAFKSQEAFISNASHQLKTPLAIIRGELDVLRSKERTSLEMEEFLESTSQEVVTLSNLVEDLLILARIGTGDVSLRLNQCSLGEIIVESIERLTRLADKKQIKIVINLQPEDSVFEIIGDEGLLRSLVDNLIENAIKYSPPHSKIEVSLFEDKDTTTIKVVDHGLGIPSDELPYIFNRFKRSQKIDHLIKGTGLGLSIVKEIADLHQAKIDVITKLNEGSTFIVEFKSH